MGLFKSTDLGEEQADKVGSVEMVKSEHSVFFRGHALPALQKLLPLPLEANSIYNYVSRGDWSQYELVEYLLSYLAPAELIFSTWSISELSARKVIYWVEKGDISSVSALVDFRAKNRHPAAYHLAKHNIANLKVAACHAKVTVLKSYVHGYVTIIGSANWTENPRIESGVIITDQATGINNEAWILETIKNGKYEIYD